MTSRRYSPEIAEQTYDAIVVGSGLGGMTTAAFLVRYGKKVLLLERHNIPGGFTHTFKRKGYEWDVGVHYVGQVGDQKNPMRRVFDYVTDGKVQWQSMGEVYDRVVIGGKTYEFVAGYEAQLAKMISYFPDEDAAIRAYFKMVRGYPVSSGMFFGERSMPWLMSRTIGRLMRRSFLRRAKRTTYEVLRELTANEELIAVLCAQCGDYGLPPKRSSFAIHAGLVDHFLNGGNYPVGGARVLAEAMLDGIESRGGRVVLGCEVVEILAHRGRARGVRLKDGTEILAKKVISNVGARNTFQKLWPKDLAPPTKILNDLEKIKPSIAHICLYVGLKVSDESLQMPKSNYWLYDTADFDGEFERRMAKPSFDPMLTYISFPSAKDPAWAAKHPNRATIQVIAPCPYAWVEAWQDKPWMKRGEDYLQFKAQWRDALLEKLYTVVPQIREHVDHCEVSTPLSTSHFSGHKHGEIYGLEHTPERMQVDWLRAHTPVKGLFLTGQDIIMVGVGGALFSGVVTSVAALKRNVMWRALRFSQSPPSDGG